MNPRPTALRALLALLLALLAGAAAAGARLELSATLASPDGPRPYATEVVVGEERVALDLDGRATLELEAGVHDLVAVVPGATVEGPDRVELREGETREVALVVTPRIDLDLDAPAGASVEGGRIDLSAVATTEFPDILPASLAIVPPEGWTAESALRVQGGVRAGLPLRLDVRLLAPDDAADEPEIRAELADWDVATSLRLGVHRPATHALSLPLRELVVAAGEEALLPVDLVNRGDEAGTISLEIAAPHGVRVEAPEAVDVEERSERQLLLPVTVAADAPDAASLRVVLRAGGRTVDEDEVALRLARADLAVAHELQGDRFLPGEDVEVRLRVANGGERAVAYLVEDATPEWLEPADAPRFSGRLEPGAEATHAYRARVVYGPEASGLLVATVRYGDRVAQAQRAIDRVHLALEGGIAETALVEGAEADLDLVLRNPLDRPVTLRARRAAEGLELLGETGGEIVLPSGATHELPLRIRAGAPGPADHTLALLRDGVLVAPPVTTAVTVVPFLEPERVSTLRVPFETRGGVEEVLLRQALPEGASYRPGSGRLADGAIDDPVVDDAGRLSWVLAAPSGELVFEVAHREGLPPLADADLTVRSRGREVALAGDASFAELPDRRPAPLEAPVGEGMIVEPVDGRTYRDIDPVRVVLNVPASTELPSVMLNGEPLGRDRVGLVRTDPETGTQRIEYYDLRLRSGANIVEVRAGEASERAEIHLAGRPVRLEIEPLQTDADGRTPVRFAVRALDERGVPAGFGPLTLTTTLEPLGPDAFPEQSGHQVLLRDGEAVAEFEPTLATRTVAVSAAWEELRGHARVLLRAASSEAHLAHGSLRAAAGADGLRLRGDLEAYAELPYEDGVLQFALDGSIVGDTDGVVAESGIAPRDAKAEDRFPLLGAGTRARTPLESEDGVAFRYTATDHALEYAYGALEAPAIGEVGRGTAARVDADLAEGLAARAFVARVPATVIEEVVVPDGTRRYVLPAVPRVGTERVVIRTIDDEGDVLDEEPLRRGRDYTLDANVGAITLARPLWPRDDDLDRVRLVVRYAPVDAERTDVAAGVGLAYERDGVEAAAGVARAVGRDGPAWEYGARAGYRAEGYGVELGYALTVPEAGDAERRDRVDATGFVEDEAWRLRASAAYDRGLQLGVDLEGLDGVPLALRGDVEVDPDGDVRGDGRLAYRLPNDRTTLAIEHERTARIDLSGLLVEHRLGAAELGAGLGYEWRSRGVDALARAAWANEVLDLEARHDQPLSGDRASRSELHAEYALAPGLWLEGDARLEWGASAHGTIGLVRQIGDGDVAVTYRLPGADGEGNRLRFGIETPLPLGSGFALDLNAGYEHGLADGSSLAAAGAALRYASEHLSGSLAPEIAREDGATKLALRAGLTGRPADAHTIGFRADYQVLPELQGSLDLSYAYRGTDLTVLTYHRLVSDETPVFEGELAANYRLTEDLQLRPSLAYRALPDDPDGTTVQFGAGATAFLTPRWGLGGAGWYVAQPATGDDALVWALEGTARVADETFVALGYGFGESAGLTPESRGGVYLRLDLFGGSQ